MREIDKTQVTEVMHGTVAHTPLINAQPVLKLQLSNIPGNFPQFIS